MLLSLSREYDNLKGGLKSSNEMCEKLKREVLTSNNKVASVDMLILAREINHALQQGLFLCCCCCCFSCTKRYWSLQRPEMT